jgi:TldD protein
MSRFRLAILAGVTGCTLAAFGGGADLAKQVAEDVQLRAMTDELARARTLQLNNLDKPYFVQYTVSDTEQFLAAASLGGLTHSNLVHVRTPRLQVRVGGYEFDNTNSVYSGGVRFGLFPLDDNYQAMRSSLWLATDALYKNSADQITRKRSALNEIADPDKTPDFAPAKTEQVLRPAPSMRLEQKRWQDLARTVSSVFASHQAVTTSHVRFRAISSTYRLVNSEGTVVRVPQQLSDVSITSGAFAPDGSRVWNHELFTALLPSQLPTEDALRNIAEKTATDTEALIKAPVAEDYSGPVLFEGEAAAQLVAQVLTDAVRLARKPLSPPGVNGPGTQILESVWASRLGSKVAPEWLTIFDDPTQPQFESAPLAGAYDVDDEGVPAQRVTLVEKGVLKSFLLSREPVRKFNASNGHGRLPGAFGSEEAVIGNLFVEANGGVSEEELKAKLLEKVKNSGLKYGLLIRRLDFPSTSNFQELQQLARQMQKSGVARTLNAPILAYKVYPDGREELVRGLRFGEFSAKDLRDVAAASNRRVVLNYVNNGSSLNIADSGSDATSSSVISPSLLFESVELVRAEGDSGRPPIVPAPILAER